MILKDGKHDKRCQAESKEAHFGVLRVDLVDNDKISKQGGDEGNYHVLSMLFLLINIEQQRINNGASTFVHENK